MASAMACPPFAATYICALLSDNLLTTGDTAALPQVKQEMSVHGAPSDYYGYS